MKILNIILLSLITLSCNCQDNINETIDLLKVQVSGLEDEILTQQETITNLLSVIDSLEGATSSGSFIRYNLDTAYVYVQDLQGNSIQAWKNGSQMTVIIDENDSIRISGDITNSQRQVFLMDNLKTKSSIIEQPDGYLLNFVDEEIKITKGK